MSGIIDVVLSCQPIPGLQAVFWAFSTLHSVMENSKHCKEQLFAMTRSVADLLSTLDRATKQQGDIPFDSRTDRELEDFENLLVEITSWIQRQSTENFLKSLYHTNDRVSSLDRYHKRLLLTIERFNVSTLVSVAKSQQMFEAARVKDQKDLETRLMEIQRDQKELAKVLEDRQGSVMSMMVSIQRALQTAESSNPIQKQFLKSSFNYLAYTSGKTPTVEPWTISSFDVEFEDVIGGGGFGQVYKGVWNHTPVALKVLKQDDVVPRESAIRSEIKIWERLRHPNLLQFLGANVLDEPPFIVMPYMRHGNAKDYIQEHPDFSRSRMLLQAARGLAHLHAENVIHGDIKAMNILIDDGLNAVLADFGLSRLKAEVSSKVTTKLAADGSTTGPGSRYWMAPERLKGAPLQFASDIYSFSMTIYEVITCEIPLGSYPLTDLFDAVVNRGLRPLRPSSAEGMFAVEMSDELWSLCEQCWSQEPSRRPTAASVCKELSPFDLTPDQLLPSVSSASLALRKLSLVSDSQGFVESPPPQYLSLVPPPVSEATSSSGSSSSNNGMRRISLLSDLSLETLPSPPLPSTPPSNHSVSPLQGVPESSAVHYFNPSPNKSSVPLPSHPWSAPTRTQHARNASAISSASDILGTSPPAMPPPPIRSQHSRDASPYSNASEVLGILPSSPDASYSPGMYNSPPLAPHRLTTSTSGSSYAMSSSSSEAASQKLTDDLALAQAYAAKGQHKEAIVILENVVQGRKTILGKDHMDTFVARSILARAYASAGRLKDACSLGEKLVKEHTPGRGTEYMINYIRVMADLMSVYHDLKRYKEATDIGGQLVKAQTAIRGEDDPDRLSYILELAGVYRSLKQFREAEQLQLHVVNKRKQLLGLSNLDTVEAQAKLASTYADQPTRLANAAALKTDVLDMRAHLQGPQHPDTVRAMASLAVTLYNQDKFEEAVVLEEKVVGFYDIMYGPLDQRTIRAKDALARTQLHLGEFRKAMDLTLQTKAKSKKGGFFRRKGTES